MHVKTIVDLDVIVSNKDLKVRRMVLFAVAALQTTVQSTLYSVP